MTKGELREIIKSHEMWLNNGYGKRANLCGADLSRTDLCGTNLRCADMSGTNLRLAYLCGADMSGTDLRCADMSGADMSGTNLRYADMSGADMSGTDLSRANLSGANLRGADMSGTDLSRAYLCGADMRGADLRGANLIGADLSGANLIGADLSGADLSGADMSGTDLSRANLSGARLNGADMRKVKYDEHTAFYALQCPEEGSFIGYKKAHGYIIKLEILADAKRSSATSRKCRCSAAKVLSITAVDGSADVAEIASDRDANFFYRVGDIVRVDNFDENKWNECSTGIHFFITRSEAEQYEG